MKPPAKRLSLNWHPILGWRKLPQFRREDIECNMVSVMIGWTFFAWLPGVALLQGHHMLGDVLLVGLEFPLVIAIFVIIRLTLGSLAKRIARIFRWLRRNPPIVIKQPEDRLAEYQEAKAKLESLVADYERGEV